MKNLVVAFMFVLVLIFSCEDSEPESDIGCLTGIPKGQNYRVTIRCCTHKQALAGDNVNAGGISNWNSYTDHKWDKCSDCN